MGYDAEKSRQESSELRAAFAAMFPLVSESDLPWAACHIQSFLRDRIRREVEDGTFHFTSRVVKVLCEVSPPKTHVEDMARIVVEECKRAREDRVRLTNELKRAEQKIKELQAPATPPAAEVKDQEDPNARNWTTR